MSEHVQIRLISLLEESGNSFEQLETLTNRALREIPADLVDQVKLLPIERDVLTDEDEITSEIDQVVFIRYRSSGEGAVSAGLDPHGDPSTPPPEP